MIVPLPTPSVPGLRALSIVVPAYCEEARLPSTLDTLEAWARAHLDRTEILIVDDGSTDGTVAVARAFAARCHGSVTARVLENGRNLGKGASVRAGVLAATLPWILMTDADLSTPIEELVLLDRARGDAELLIGSRSISGSNVTRHQPLHRELMGKTFNKFVRLLVLGGLADTQCGFKLFSRDVGREIFARTRIDRFAFDVEVLFLARRLGHRVIEVPVRWHDSPASTVHPVADASRMLMDLLRIRWIHRGG